MIVAFVWFAAREGENVRCGCWADDRYAWQYTVQFLLAIGGTIAVGEAAVAYARGRRAGILARCALVAIVLGAWVTLFISAEPPGWSESALTVPSTIRQALLVHPPHAARAAGREPTADRSG